jgi:hypothetical protein
MTNRKTFREILQETAEGAGYRLADRARLASHTAKHANNLRSKRLAYDVKRAALEHAVERLPDQFGLGGLEQDGRLLRMQYRNEASFHLPVRELAAPTQDWMTRERARIVAGWQKGRVAA